jgi:hypothetical protein
MADRMQNHRARKPGGFFVGAGGPAPVAGPMPAEGPALVIGPMLAECPVIAAVLGDGGRAPA